MLFIQASRPLDRQVIFFAGYQIRQLIWQLPCAISALSTYKQPNTAVLYLYPIVDYQNKLLILPGM